jgi:hypothetical protein
VDVAESTGVVGGTGIAGSLTVALVSGVVVGVVLEGVDESGAGAAEIVAGVAELSVAAGGVCVAVGGELPLAVSGLIESQSPGAAFTAP